MEKSWKVVEEIRDGRDEPAWEAAQALAKAVLERREVILATAILEGGPHALRRALELADQIIEAEKAAGDRKRGETSGDDRVPPSHALK